MTTTTEQREPLPQYAIWFCAGCGQCKACRKAIMGYFCRECSEKNAKPGDVQSLMDIFGPGFGVR
jgi:predicted RNA-binding Zn-ribbon protein involved in translation (DUF1610 family)